MKILPSPWLYGFWKEVHRSVLSLSASVLFLASGSDPQWLALEGEGLALGHRGSILLDCNRD